MLEFQEKKKLRKFIYSPLFLGLLLVAIIIVGRGTWGVFQKSKESRERLQASLAELETLQAREENISEEIEQFSTPRGVEQEIREKYRVAKEGEHMIILLGDKEAPKPVEEPKLPWWKRIFR